MARWQFCNVLHSGRGLQHLWQFNAASKKLNLQREESSAQVPEKLVAKDWQHLLQPRLNVAWLQPDHVFLRVVQLPRSDLPETRSMVDLQLEKLSPLPVMQVVWSFEVLSSPDPQMQTVVVIIVPRQVVDEFLGGLEAQEYLADRLELPLLDILKATEINADGAWIYPGLGKDRQSCLVSWWYGGTLSHLTLLHLPLGPEAAERLREQLSQTIWAGELEGWLSSPPRFHLVVAPEESEQWRVAFGPDDPVTVVPPLPDSELAALTARRAIRNSETTNLLPPEYAARYRQQLIDRLWMRALAGVAALYIAGVAVYLGLVQVVRWQQNKVQAQIGQLSGSYTNTLRLKEQVNVLQNQLDLQFAALNAWRAVAENLPPEITLESLSFERGSTVRLSGTAGADDIPVVWSFNEQISNVRVENQPLFAAVKPPNIQPRPGANQISWIFSADLKRAESE